MFRNTMKTTVLLAALGGLMVGIGSIFGRGGAIIGLGLGLVAAGLLLLQFPRVHPPSPAMQLLVGVLLSTHLLAAVLVLQLRTASRPISALLLATVGVVVLGQLVPPTGLAGGGIDAGLWLARNRPGGLTDSCARLEARLAEYR